MNGRNIALLVVAAVISVAVAWGFMNFLSSTREGIKEDLASQRMVVPPTIPTSRVLVAKNDLVVGTFVRTEDLHWQEWPQESVVPSYVTEGVSVADAGRDEKKLTINDFVGTVVRLPIAAGQPMTPGLVARAGERGFLAAVLRPGMRAVSVNVTQTSGISGFILPGDRVDMIWRVQNKDLGGPFSQTLMTDLRVIAVDQSTQASNATLAKTITLEVTPKQSEAIALASDVGQLDFALRSIAPEEDRVAGADSDGLKLSNATDGVAPGSLLGGSLLAETGTNRSTDIARDSRTLAKELLVRRRGQSEDEGGGNSIRVVKGNVMSTVWVKN